MKEKEVLKRVENFVNCQWAGISAFECQELLKHYNNLKEENERLKKDLKYFKSKYKYCYNTLAKLFEKINQKTIDK